MKPSPWLPVLAVACCVTGCGVLALAAILAHVVWGIAG